MTTLLSSFGFVAALVTLLLNDLVLKHVAGGFVTGKLSDFAGLFVFAIFWSALFPRQRVAIHYATAALFLWWKLPLSQPFIEFWNAHAPWSIGRTVDLTDLVALAAVIAAYMYSARPRRQLGWPVLRWATIPIALFSFAATTALRIQPYQRTYVFRAEPAQLRSSLDQLGIVPDSLPNGYAVDSTVMVLRVPVSGSGGFRVAVALLPDSLGSALTLRTLLRGGFPERHDSVTMIAVFEQCVVQRLDSLLTGGAAMRPGSVSFPSGQPARYQWCVR